MKVKLKDGSTEDLTTGQAMRLIQAGEAVAVDSKTPNKQPEKTADDKPKQSSRTARAAKDSSTDVSGD